MSASCCLNSAQELLEQGGSNDAAFSAAGSCLIVRLRGVRLEMASCGPMQLSCRDRSVPLEGDTRCTSTCVDAESAPSMTMELSLAPDSAAAPVKPFGAFLLGEDSLGGNSVGTAFGFNFFQPSARFCSKLSSSK